MPIIEDNLDDMDCVLIQQVVQVRTKEDSSKERQQLMEIGSSQEQEGAVSRKGSVLIWEARVKVIFDNSKVVARNSYSKSPEKERPRKLLRKAPRGYMETNIGQSTAWLQRRSAGNNAATATSDVHSRHKS